MINKKKIKAIIITLGIVVTIVGILVAISLTEKPEDVIAVIIATSFIGLIVFTIYKIVYNSIK